MTRVCVRACVRACVRVGVRACVRASEVRACVRALLRACVRAGVRACVHACMRACVRASEVRACVRTCVRAVFACLLMPTHSGLRERMCAHTLVRVHARTPVQTNTRRRAIPYYRCTAFRLQHPEPVPDNNRAAQLYDTGGGSKCRYRR